MLITTLLASLALASTPAADLKVIQVEYHLTMDLDKMSDMACKISGMCDCETTYVGTGKAIGSEENAAIFQGTWAIAETTCSESFTLWVPEDKAAHHTVRLDAKGQITEWVVHGDKDNSTPLTEGIKAGGQVYLNEMTLGFAVGTPAVHDLAESQSESGVGLSTTHKLTITLK